MNRHLLILVVMSIIGLVHVHGRELSDKFIRLPSEKGDFFKTETDDDSIGTKWAVLVAGSNGYWNYRHQADVCHAYKILKNGGIKDENIVVFMYDDIAYNRENPRQGVIINSPDGDDVYKGVPKDYTGNDVNVDNFFAVLLGDKSQVKGGSGKVVDSGPDDHIFIYYIDHGGPGVLGMPTFPYLYANDLNEVLKKKHAAGTYKSMVFYLEACEAGSIFERLLPEGLNIYATTASDPNESSWGNYCPGEYPSPPMGTYLHLGSTNPREPRFSSSKSITSNRDGLIRKLHLGRKPRKPSYNRWIKLSLPPLFPPKLQEEQEREAEEWI